MSADPVHDLARRIESVQRRIRAAEARFGRPAGAVTLLAVSKTRPAGEVREAAALGLSRFGENYLQEALDKRRELEDLALEWHFIGPIQSNKTRPIAENFNWVHSVDRLKIARRLSEQRPEDLPPLNICLQVNIDAEPTKSGLNPDEVTEVAREVAALSGLKLRGLMAIPAPNEDFEAQRRPLARLRQLQEALVEQGLALDTLSMGMTDDLEAAVAEGATLVRIGTALFGPRPVAKTHLGCSFPSTNGKPKVHAMKPTTIAFIGGGNMARSLIGGLIQDGSAPTSIRVSDPSEAQLQDLARRFGVETHADNATAVAGAQVVVLAVKPQVLGEVARSLAPAIQQQRPLVVSIAAGVRAPDLEAWLGGNLPLVRTMPNTPSLVGSGATGLYANKRVDEAQRQMAESLLRAVGLTVWVDDEALLDAVTAVSGSGPAYFFLVMEALEAAGRDLGLEDRTAHLLALQTAFGAAKMALESDEGPAELRRRVTSPGGTTERAIGVLEDGGLRTLFATALKAAAKRSRELGDMLGGQ